MIVKPANHSLIFVYGTLKSNKVNHRYLYDSKFLGDYVTVKKYAFLVNGLPFLIGECDKGLNVKGELYAVSRNVLDFLDRFEGHPTHYTRTPIELESSEDGVAIWAETYLYTHVDLVAKDYSKFFISEY